MSQGCWETQADPVIVFNTQTLRMRKAVSEEKSQRASEQVAVAFPPFVFGSPSHGGLHPLSFVGDKQEEEEEQAWLWLELQLDSSKLGCASRTNPTHSASARRAKRHMLSARGGGGEGEECRVGLSFHSERHVLAAPEIEESAPRRSESSKSGKIMRPSEKGDGRGSGHQQCA